MQFTHYANGINTYYNFFWGKTSIKRATLWNKQEKKYPQQGGILFTANNNYCTMIERIKMLITSPGLFAGNNGLQSPISA
jgi:hypothetical protein